MSMVIPNITFDQQEIIESFSLESLAGSPNSLVSEIVSWTGNNLWLTKYLCQAIVDVNYFIPSGMEAVLVEKIIEKRVIRNWQNKKIAKHFNKIQEYFFTQSESYSRTLLLTYSDIWQQKQILLDKSQETEQLIALGLVTEQENYFQVSNRLYQFIFDYDWVQQQLFAIKLMNATPSRQLEKKASKKTLSFSLNSFTSPHNKRFSQALAFISWSGLGLIVSLIFFPHFQTKFMPDIEIEKSRSEKQFFFQMRTRDTLNQQDNPSNKN